MRFPAQGVGYGGYGTAAAPFRIEPVCIGGIDTGDDVRIHLTRRSAKLCIERCISVFCRILAGDHLLADHLRDGEKLVGRQALIKMVALDTWANVVECLWQHKVHALAIGHDHAASRYGGLTLLAEDFIQYRHNILILFFVLRNMLVYGQLEIRIGQDPVVRFGISKIWKKSKLHTKTLRAVDEIAAGTPKHGGFPFLEQPRGL